MHGAKKRLREKTIWLIAVFLIIASGIAYRAVAAKLQVISSTPVTLPVPLSQFPRSIGTWEGEDVPLSAAIQRVAGNDDFVNRRYRNTAENAWASVYIAYTARPRTMRGHKPQVCYPAAGWVLDHTETIQLESTSGRQVSCLIHQFSRPTIGGNGVTVLNYYVVNGKMTCNEGDFSGVAWRTPNINGNPARYVAQVQISSSLESYARLAAREMVEPILSYLPDANGVVAIAQHL